MLSLELARKLKVLGLKWTPKENDEVRGPLEGTYMSKDVMQEYNELDDVLKETFIEKTTWLPSLSQLLAEIEGRGYWWETNHRSVDNGIRKYKTWVSKKHSNNNKWLYMADTPEDSAAQTLLCILEREKDGN
jgi:hypothetical protein